MGCYATRAPAEVAALPGVAEVVTDKRELPDLLARFGVVDMPDGNLRHSPTGSGRTSKCRTAACCDAAFASSRRSGRIWRAGRPKQIVAEVGGWSADGFREIVLTGIHLGHYGVERNRGRPKSDWLRLGAIGRARLRWRLQAGDFRRAAFEHRGDGSDARVARRDGGAWPERVCPHLHVSMQSGSESVLRRMRRRWGAQRFLDRCRLARDMLDQPALTTDIIVGFPGETEAEFQETCDLAREVGFSKIHIFPFSARPGTGRGEMPEQVPPEVKAERCRRLAAVGSRTARRYFRQLIGRRLQVLVESPVSERPGQMIGTACRYAPVEIPEACQHQFCDAEAIAVRDGHVVGRL